MLDIGWTELLVVAIVLIIVVGPKDLPPMLRAFGRTTTKLRKMANEFRGQFDDALREADLDDVRKTISDARSLNPMNQIREAVNPLRQAGSQIRSDLEKSVKPVAIPDSGMKLDGDPKVESDRAVEAQPLKGAVDTADKPASEPAGKPVATKTTKSKAASGKAPAKKAETAKPTAKPATKSGAKSSAVSASKPAAATKTPTKAASKPAAKPAASKPAASKPAASKPTANKTAAAKSAAAKPEARKASTTAKKTSRKTSDKA
jgi:sec-independent protein translocase protein TatB